jgi:5,10-methylenetetrahydrofolate reductase
MANTSFEVVAEIEPATKPDLTRVRHQVGVLAPVSDAFLIPDNHLGRATMSSVAVAHEVASMGVRAIACLNSRSPGPVNSGCLWCRPLLVCVR